MGRLIDADKLIDDLRSLDERSRNNAGMVCWFMDTIVQVITNQPTAFDIEELINKLDCEKAKDQCGMKNQQLGATFERGKREAYRIVIKTLRRSLE